MLDNAHDMVDLLRDNIGEGTASLWTNLSLLRLLNQAYMEVYRRVSLTPGQWLVKSASVTCADSVITLPTDCLKPVYLEDVNDNPVSFINSVGQRRVSRMSGVGSGLYSHDREAYILKGTIEINEDSVSETMTLWYQKRPVILHAGTATASTAGSLTLEDSLRHPIDDDHYNNGEVDVISGSNPARYSITDYDGGTRVLTLTPTDDPGISSYGIVPTTPEECNDYIILRATVLAMSRPSANIDEKVYQMFTSDARRARSELYEWLDTRVIEGSGISIGDVYL